MRARTLLRVGLLVVLSALLIAPGGLAQTFLTPGEIQLELGAGEVTESGLRVKSAVNYSLSGFARLKGDVAKAVTVEPDEFELGPRAERELSLTVRANELERGEHHGAIQVLLVNPETGDTHRLRSNVTVSVPAPALLFNTWQNPLPPPADGVVGLFVLESAIWIIGAFVVMNIAARGTRFAMRGAPRWVKSEVVGKFTTPLFATLVLWGVRETWRFFPDDGLAAVVHNVLTALIVLSIAFLVYRSTDSAMLYLKEQVAPKTKTKWDDIIIPVARKAAVALLIAFALFYALQGLGVDLGFLVAGGIVIGLVLSNSLGPTLQNLFSGLFIMLDRPFREGDDIRLDTGEVCNVRQIGLRSTRLYFYRNHEYIVAPNKDLENTRVVNLNFPDSRYKMHIQVGVAYGSPIQDVRRILLEIADAHPEVHIDEEMRSGVFLDDFGESGLLFRLVVLVESVSDRFRIASEMRDMIEERFRAGDITIPFPQRTLWHRQLDVTLREDGADREP